MQAITWWRAFLSEAAPRILRLGSPAPPVLLFGDGACEVGIHGVGAVLHDPDQGIHEVFGFNLAARVGNAIIEGTGYEHIIAQLELVPFLLALWQWPHAFREAGRRVIVFCDNEAARCGLIRGYSPEPVMRELIAEIWIELARLQVAPWFERVPSAGI